MAAYKNIAVIGASGNIGKIILNSILTSSDFNITVISRAESDAVFPNGVTVRKSDFSLDDLAAAFKGQDAVISVVGAAAMGDQKKLVDAAVLAGVKRFFPSEFSADSQNEVVLQLLPLFAPKKELIEYLKAKESTGLSWTAIAAGPLFDWSLENGFLQYDLANRTALIWDGGNSSFSVTNERELGQAVSTTLHYPEKTANKFLYISSFETTQNEIVAALENVTGAKWTVTTTTAKEQVDQGREKLGAGDINGAFMLVRATTHGNTPGINANFAKNGALANSLLGLKPETLEETVKRVVAKQAH